MSDGRHEGMWQQNKITRPLDTSLQHDTQTFGHLKSHMASFLEDRGGGGTRRLKVFHNTMYTLNAIG